MSESNGRAKQYVWEARWLTYPVPDSEDSYRAQLFGSPDLRRARIKAVNYQESEKFDGELVSIVRRTDVVL